MRRCIRWRSWIRWRSIELFITSDADVRVTKDYLRRMVQNLKDPRMGLASCVYLGTTDAGTKAGFSSQLDAVGKSVEMTSGVLVADMLEGTKFALGVSMAVRKESFQKAGGFEELGQFYADDFVLGNRLAAQGIGVRMATHVIRLMVQDSPFRIVVPEPAAVDAEHAAIAAAGASGVGAYVCGSVWSAGIDLGIAERPCVAGSWCGWRRWF